MSEEITIFAETDFRNQRQRFGIKKDDRRRHIYIIGKTGTGKTTLLENMAIQDIQEGRGVAIVDPHGEFAEKMLDFVPSHRVNDVIYFNPADMDFPIAFNAIEKVDLEHRHLVASGLVGVFKKIWAESWGPRLEYVLRNAILTLLEYPGSTLLGIMRLLIDKTYRQKVVEKIKDPVIKSFWLDEFSKYRGNFEVEAIAPIQNKVGQFLTNPLIRNIVGQTRSSINIREVMDEQKIFIINLSKGRIGEDTSNLLGAMLITRLQLAAMSRVDILEEERRDFYLYVDEFQNFATESFANILSEARKYHLNLVLAHQYITQVPEEVRDAVFGNVGTMISFRVGAADAEFLEKEFSPEFIINDLVGLGFAQIYLKLMINGFSSRPFSAKTLSPIQKPEVSYRENIIKVSRERYGRPRREIEEKIARWSGVLEEEKGEEKEFSEFSTGSKSVQDHANLPVFEDKCWECGKKVELNFKPDGVRPVYCKDCLAKVRAHSLPSHLKKETPSLSGESALRSIGQPVSLKEVLKGGGQINDNFSKKKPRREVNLNDLRQTLKEVMEKEEIRKKEKPALVPNQSESVSVIELPKINSETKELNPGETVEL